MLADEKKSHLHYTAGFGHTEKQETFLRGLEFNLNNPESKGLFILTMRESKPVLIQDIREIQDTLSPRSLEFAKQMGGQSVICVPIIYEQEALGILAVDNIKSETPLRQSDMNLLMGVASQLATSIMNARSLCQTTTERKQISRTCRNGQQYYPADGDGWSHYFFPMNLPSGFLAIPKMKCSVKMPNRSFCRPAGQIVRVLKP